MKKAFFPLAILLLSAVSHAQPLAWSNVYLDGFVGANFVERFEEKGGAVSLNTGIALGGAVGYRFANLFRVEAEAAFRGNSFHSVSVYDLDFPASGHVHKFTLMANGIFEFPLTNPCLTPYFGAGVGHRWDDEVLEINPIVTDEVIIIFESLKSRSNKVAYQAIAGVTFAAGKNWHSSVEYRYLNGPDIQANHTLDFNLRRYF